ncbi:uncharacterized protein LOC106393729 [Brassica napus]|uniref:uncharacterized protein LOC106304555 n=1 Tax=Brassica oleracea var. oleracea TaxID=109376 RepID=UPI0006A6CD50|nr:PREDICTED: uncharacterized protein LOC106304555 [Brassica oleracea var. oleracea]XP_013689879.2 uncharacterized protein LOC106393729 [Brassica napus]
MKRYYRDLLLIISIISFAFAEELQCCSDKTDYLVHKERPAVGVTSSERAHGRISEVSKARGVYGGGSLVRPTGKKNRAMSSMTKSASLAVIQVTVAILVHLFLH